MADLGDKLEPIAASLLEPGEELRGCCLATRQSAFRGQMVAVVTTPTRLIVQGMTRKFEPSGDPISLPPERIADAKVEGGGGGWLEVGPAILDGVSVALKIRTADGAKLKLTMMRAEGPFGRLGGGDAQRQGLEAVGNWFAEHAG